MRLPIIPIVIAATLLAIGFYLFNTVTSGKRTLDVPQLSRLADIEGTETEVALSPDGSRCAVIADGDLWMLHLSDGSRVRITDTPEPEAFPSWSQDGRITFTRGADTFILPGDATSGTGQLFKSDATNMSWSATGRLVFARSRALWITDAGGRNEKQIVEADANPNITVHAPRFSPDSLQIAFIERLLNLSGEVWTVDAAGGAARALVADRGAEYPLDVGWIMEGQELIYLTNRSGAYSIWHVNFGDNTILPLTPTLITLPLAPVGMSVWKDRIVLPRHFVNSNIATLTIIHIS
jgi:Tol biopolymer transport system component